MIKSAFLLCLLVSVTFAQDPKAFAGRSVNESISSPLAISAGTPAGVAIDSDGNVYVSSRRRRAIYRLSRLGQVTHIAGNGGTQSTGDGGLAVLAGFRSTSFLLADSLGNLFVVDENRLRRIDRQTGVIQTVYTAAQPGGLDFDAGGSILMAVPQLGRILRIDAATGAVATVAGGGTLTENDVPGNLAALFQPLDVKRDTAGNLYIADDNGRRVRQIAPGGIIRTIAGGGGFTPIDGLPGLSANFSELSPIRWIAPEPAGTLLIATSTSIWRLRNGILERVAGAINSPSASTDNVPAIQSTAGGVSGVTDSLGNIYIADDKNLRRIRAADRVIETIFGNGEEFYCGTGSESRLGCFLPATMRWTGDRVVFVHYGSSFTDARLLEVTNTGRLNAIVDRVGAGARFNNIFSIEATASYYYVLDGSAVRRISRATNAVTDLGITTPKFTVDPADNVYYLSAVDGQFALTRESNGVATMVAQGLPLPFEMLWTPSGIYLTTGTSVLRVIGGLPVKVADATSPQGLAADAAGALYYVETAGGQSLIQRVDASGIRTTVAALDNATTPRVRGLAAAADGTLFYADNDRQQIMVIGNPCLYGVDRTNLSVAPLGDIGKINVLTSPGCAWTTGNSAPWVTLETSGVNEVRYVATPNPGSTSRSADFNIAGVPIHITQPGRACTYQLSTRAIAALSTGGSFPLTVITEGGCEYAATVSQSWLSVVGDRIIVASNPDAQPRNGQVVIAGQQVQVLQKGTGNSQPFLDVPAANIFSDAISLISGIALRNDCPANSYCPDSPTNRGEVAALIVRSLFGGDTFPSPGNPFFQDVPTTHPYFRHIQKLRDMGVTTGCTATNFCPGDPVTRGQMAAFLVRTMFGIPSNTLTSFPFPDTLTFTDVLANNIFYSHVQKLFQLGITNGCSATEYCPNSQINRGQMAVFLVRGLFR